MNNANLKSDGNIPELIIKLCKSFASHDEVLESILIGKLLSLLQNVNITTSSGSLDSKENPADHEQFIFCQIRDFLKNKSVEDAEKFELLYSNIAKSKLIKNRAMLLKFLYCMATDKNLRKQTTPTDVTHLLNKDKNFHIKMPSNNLQLRESSSSIRNLFDAGEMKFISNSESSAIQLKSNLPQSNTTPTPTTISSGWSNFDLAATATSKSLYSYNESEIVQDVIYILHGIPGKFFRKETCVGSASGYLGYTLEPKATKTLCIKQRILLERIIDMSFLHNQLKEYCDGSDKHCGMINQAFIATLNLELSEYYKTIALLQTSVGLNKTDTPNQLSGLTLRRILYILQEVRTRFEWLSYIAEQCNDKKGGGLITVVHGFMQHGSRNAQQVAEQVLKAVCKPFYIILSRWLLNGEINDPSNEFFIESKNIMSAERLWYDKYSVRKLMIPSFINIEQAKRILAIGKSINFLRHICQDNGELPGSEALQNLFNGNSAEALFIPELSIEFHSKLEEIYQETSLRVLDLLKHKFKLYDHLQSLRRYLLLGQGDFIRHLLELLTPELNKLATTIYGHNLSSILETATRVTNAQYENEDTLKRLNIRFMSHSYGDLGWDVFSLVYVVDGPIGTIFQPTMSTYQSLFGALWKAKRTEFVLANMRRQQLAMAKLFRKIKELKPVMHTIHILTSKMIHFIHQTQYYFLFEVLECSWAEMQHKVDQADCLDKIIQAHSEFLSSIRRSILLDDDSRQLFSHLISIYNFVVNLETYQDAIYKTTQETYGTKDYSSVDGRTTQKNDEKKVKENSSLVKFHQFLNKTKLKVKTSAQTYDIIVSKFLELLATNSNVKLQLLSVRLNFNDFYKIA